MKAERNGRNEKIHISKVENIENEKKKDSSKNFIFLKEEDIRSKASDSHFLDEKNHKEVHPHLQHHSHISLTSHNIEVKVVPVSKKEEEEINFKLSPDKNENLMKSK